MDHLRALLTHSSGSLPSQESSRCPNGWPLQDGPMWVEARASTILDRGDQASLRLPGALGVLPIHPEALPSRLALPCDPSSQLGTVLASAVPRTPEGRMVWAQTAAAVAPASRGKRWSVRGPRTCPGFSRHTAVASRRSSGHQRAKGQRDPQPGPGSLILHVPQQGVGTGLAQGG